MAGPVDAAIRLVCDEFRARTRNVQDLIPQTLTF